MMSRKMVIPSLSKLCRVSLQGATLLLPQKQRSIFRKSGKGVAFKSIPYNIAYILLWFVLFQLHLLKLPGHCQVLWLVWLLLSLQLDSKISACEQLHLELCCVMTTGGNSQMKNCSIRETDCPSALGGRTEHCSAQLRQSYKLY